MCAILHSVLHGIHICTLSLIICKIASTSASSLPFRTLTRAPASSSAMASSPAPKKASSLPSPCLPRALLLRFPPPASARPDSWRGTDHLFLPQVLLPVANGTEPMEAVITADVLRRAGAEVAVASVEPGAATVAASWGVKLAADALIADLADTEFDLISLPVSAPDSALLAFQYLNVLLYMIKEMEPM
jgi:protein deglycase